MIIGERIKQRRSETGLTQASLAKMVGVSREAVSQWESGDSKGLKQENLLECSKALNCSPHWLVTGKEITAHTITTTGQKPGSGSPVEPVHALNSEAVKHAFWHLNSLMEDKKLYKSFDEDYIVKIFSQCYRAYFDDELRQLSTMAHLRLVP